MQNHDYFCFLFLDDEGPHFVLSFKEEAEMLVFHPKPSFLSFPETSLSHPVYFSVHLTVNLTKTDPLALLERRILQPRDLEMTISKELSLKRV